MQSDSITNVIMATAMTLDMNVNIDIARSGSAGVVLLSLLLNELRTSKQE